MFYFLMNMVFSKALWWILGILLVVGCAAIFVEFLLYFFVFLLVLTLFLLPMILYFVAEGRCKKSLGEPYSKWQRPLSIRGVFFAFWMNIFMAVSIIPVAFGEAWGIAFMLVSVAGYIFIPYKLLKGKYDRFKENIDREF